MVCKVELAECGSGQNSINLKKARFVLFTEYQLPKLNPYGSKNHLFLYISNWFLSLFPQYFRIKIKKTPNEMAL